MVLEKNLGMLKLSNQEEVNTMAISEQDYYTSRRERQQLIQRIFALVSIISFGGTGVFGAFQFISTAFANSKVERKVGDTSPTSKLELEVRGYEAVLKREPDNQTALEGLANTKIQMKDIKGAIAPVEKLVKLYPERTDYQQQLATLKQQINQN